MKKKERKEARKQIIQGFAFFWLCLTLYYLLILFT